LNRSAVADQETGEKTNGKDVGGKGTKGKRTKDVIFGHHRGGKPREKKRWEYQTEKINGKRSRGGEWEKGHRDQLDVHSIAAH